MDYIVSAHGGRWNKPEHKIWLPEGVTVNFFVLDGEVLDDKTAWKFLELLLAGNEAEVNKKIVESVAPGDGVYNYSCWNYPEIKPASGIFEVGAGNCDNPVINLDEQDGNNPVTLSQIISSVKNPGVIYWLACRTVS